MRIVVILLVAWLIQAVARRMIKTFRVYMERRTAAPDELRRIDTVGTALRYFATVLVFLVAGTLVLGELGISITPILATAGVAGIALGFGAQNLIKDYFNGFFLLLEDQIREGDVAEVAGKSGQVEEVTLRYVRLRDFEGRVHFIPNGEIKVVTNHTRDFAYALIEVGVDYGEDPEKAFQAMRDVAQQMRQDPAWRDKLPEDIEIIGVERLGDSAVILRSRLTVRPPIQQWNVKREFQKRLKKTYDERGIEIPFPHLTIYRGSKKKP